MADYNPYAWIENVTKVGPTRLNALEAGVGDAATHHKSGTYAARPPATAANKNWTYFATDAGVLYCNFDGATWTRVGADAPIGGVQDFMGHRTKLAPGWRLLDGSSLSRTTYADLFGAVTAIATAIDGSQSGTNMSIHYDGPLGYGGLLASGLYIEGPGLPSGTTITGVGVVGGPVGSRTQGVTVSNAFSGTIPSGATYIISPWPLTDGTAPVGTVFVLPNSGDRVTVGAGSANVVGAQTARVEGQSGGEETHLLTGPESGIQAHSHGAQGHNFLIDGPGGVAFVTGSSYNVISTTSNAGPSNAQNAHNNMQPFIVMAKMVKVY